MYVRRDSTRDLSRAAPYLDAALGQFRALGMAGFISSMEESRQGHALAASDETQRRLSRERSTTHPKLQFPLRILLFGTVYAVPSGLDRPFEMSR